MALQHKKRQNRSILDALRSGRRLSGDTPDHTGPEHRQLLLRLYRELLVPRRAAYLAAAACMLVVAGATAAVAWLMRDVINGIFVARDRELLWLVSAAVAAAFFIKGLADYAARILLGRIGTSLTRALRQRFFAHLLRQELSLYLRISSSDLVARLVREIDAVRMTAELLVTGATRDLLTLLGLVLVMVLQQPLLFAIAIPSTLAVILLLGRLSRLLGRVVRAEHQADVALIATVQETARGVRSVKAFGLEQRLQERFAALTAASEQRANRIIGITALGTPLAEGLGGLAIAAAIFYGGWAAISAGQAPGELMAFVTALLLAYEPARRLSHLRLQLEQRLVLVAAFYAFLDETTDRPSPARPPCSAPAGPVPIRLEGVDFRFQPDHPLVIADLTLELATGKVTLVCGPTGSGKSTLVDLVLGFHQPTSGRILIGDRDLQQLSAAARRAFYAYVGQDVFLFDASIAENIRLGREDLSEQALQALGRATLLDALVAGLPQGYDTRVGEQGARLSGGERQRIAIARALAKEAPTLVLDEATAALDPITERAILANLRQLRPAATLLIISHRVAPIAIADAVLVIEQGRQVEQGRPQDLLVPGTRLQALFGAQADPARQPSPADPADARHCPPRPDTP